MKYEFDYFLTREDEIINLFATIHYYKGLNEFDDPNYVEDLTYIQLDGKKIQLSLKEEEKIIDYFLEKIL